VSFEIEAPDNTVEYQLWYTSSDDRSLDFLADMGEYDTKLGEHATFTPRFVFWECLFCDQRLLLDNCWGQGKYCAVDTTNTEIKGVEIMTEDLRHKCIHQMAKDKSQPSIYWNYVKTVKADCHGLVNEDCSRTGLAKVGLDFAQVMDCVNASFSLDDWSKAEVQNAFIDDDIANWLALGTMRFPIVVINNLTFRGHLDAYGVAEALCGAFADKSTCHKQGLPDFGLNTSNERKKMHYISHGDTGMDVKTVFLVLFCCIAVNICLVLLYRRHMKREISREMNLQIDAAAAQYMALASNPDQHSDRKSELQIR